MGIGFILLFVFLFGLIFGSFLNVCIYRLPRPGMSIIFPASHCPKCGHPIPWYDNIPFLSYLFLLGRCRYCKAPISWRYPLVELLTAVLFTYAFTYHFGFHQIQPVTKGLIIEFIISLYLISTMIIVSFIDFEFQIIPVDEITRPGIIIALVLSLFLPDMFRTSWLFGREGSIVNSVTSVVGGMIVGGGIVYLIGVLGKIVFRKEAMGRGDVELMAMLGGFLGIESIIYVFFLGCFFGAIVGIVSWLITRKHYLPFGPYLALGALLMHFCRPEIITFATRTYPELVRRLISG